MELKLKPLNLPGIENKRPLVIAGPCSAETEEQVMATAKALAKNDIKIRRRHFLRADWETPCAFLPNLMAGYAIFEISKDKHI